jgi:hypothetical protein
MIGGLEVAGYAQVWDGGPDRVLPEGVIVDYLDFLEALLDAGPPDGVGEDIVDVLKNGALMRLAAGEVSCEQGTDRAIVVLWLPYYEDQRMFVLEGERVAHEAIPEVGRWRDAETALGALSVGYPSQLVQFGFLAGERATVFPWNEFCRVYDQAPQYVVATWGDPSGLARIPAPGE